MDIPLSPDTDGSSPFVALFFFIISSLFISVQTSTLKFKSHENDSSKNQTEHHKMWCRFLHFFRECLCALCYGWILLLLLLLVCSLFFLMLSHFNAMLSTHFVLYICNTFNDLSDILNFSWHKSKWSLQVKLDEFEVFGEAILQNAHNVHKKRKKLMFQLCKMTSPAILALISRSSKVIQTKYQRTEIPIIDTSMQIPEHVR